jgi:hypothetical protein
MPYNLKFLLQRSYNWKFLLQRSYNWKFILQRSYNWKFLLLATDSSFIYQIYSYIQSTNDGDKALTFLWLLTVINRSVVFSIYTEFLHQYNWPPRYSWNIVECGVKHYNLKLYLCV